MWLVCWLPGQRTGKVVSDVMCIVGRGHPISLASFWSWARGVGTQYGKPWPLQQSLWQFNFCLHLYCAAKQNGHMSKTVHSSITRNELTISPKRGHPKLNICKQFLGRYFLVRSSFLYFLVILFHNSWTISWSYQWETDFKYTYIPVYCCSVHNNQKLEIDSMSVNGWVDSENVACLHNRIYSPVKKKKKEHVRKTEGPGH